MEVIPYTPDLRPLWDSFVATSRNATFQHLRGYMDYHSDRFADRSLLLTRRKGEIVALLPAATGPDEALASHGGLSFGGLLLPAGATDANAALEAMEAVAAHYRREGFREMVYKAIPYIYHTIPAQEDLYALFRLGAKWTACNISSTLSLDAPLPFSRTQRRYVNQALREGITVEQTDDFTTYWHLLARLLAGRYGASPVHTEAEIRLLAGRFPENIRLWAARDEAGEMLAGVVVYVSRTVAHAQYIAASEEGKRRHVLPLLFQRIIEHYSADGRLRWFDFGTSNENGGRYLNAGLLNQKAQLGGRGVTYNTYLLPL